MFKRVVPDFSRLIKTSYQCFITQQRSISTLFSNVKANSNLQSNNQIIQNGTDGKLLQNKTFNYQSVRTWVVHFKPSVWKRAHKHGLEKTLAQRGLKEAMFRKFIRGRRDLLVVDKIMNYPVKSKKAQKQLPTLHKGLCKFYPHQRQVPVWKKP